MVVEMGPESEHSHHRHTGHRLLDVVLGVSAIVISLVSLFLAIQHGRVMERMVEASTWPYVIVDVSTYNMDGTPHVRLQILNKGVGPARIDSLEVFYNGEAQSTSRSLLNAILRASDANRRPFILTSDVTNMVLSAREEIDFVDLNAKNYEVDEYSRIAEAVEKELEFRVCYCSVFEQCSVLDTRVAPRPVAVKSCQVPKKPFLH